MNHLKYELRRQICPELHSLRQERKLTLKEIALQTDLSMESIDQIEMGQASSYQKLKRLAHFYGKKIDFSLAD